MEEEEKKVKQNLMFDVTGYPEEKFTENGERYYYTRPDGTPITNSNWSLKDLAYPLNLIFGGKSPTDESWGLEEGSQEQLNAELSKHSFGSWLVNSAPTQLLPFLGGAKKFKQIQSNKKVMKGMKYQENVEDVTGFGDKQIGFRVDDYLNSVNNLSLVDKENIQKLKGIKNKGLIKDFTSGSLKKGGLFDPKRDDTTKLLYSSTPNNDPSLLIGNILNVGDSGFRYGKGINKLTAPEFIDQRFQSYGFKKGPNGGWFLDRETYYKLPSNQQREIIQIMQTGMEQTVPLSFTKDKIKKNLELNKDLADYNAKYGARAELHHSFPSALSAEFFLDKEYMGPEWKELIRIANDEFGNYPGQPFGVDENSNLVAVPSKIGSNHPNYDAVVARYGKVPSHLHNIIHSQFFANETGMSGKKFFNQDRLAKMDEGFEGELEVWREWNAIIKRNREMWEEALAQLDVFFSKASLSENPEKLTELLEQYLSKGKITIGQGLVRDKDGNVVLAKKGTDTALGKMQTATYAQFPVNDIVKAALADFKKDANQLLNKDPRLADISKEVSTIPGLSQEEIQTAEDLLFKIKYYNTMVLTTDKNRAYQVTRISAAENKKNIKKYRNLIQLKIPNLKLTETNIQSKVFSDVKLPTIEKQMELILDPQPEQLDLFK